MPAIRQTAGRPVAAYVFVDAGLPADGARLDQGGFGSYLWELYARGERFPNWTDADLRDVIPDQRLRRDSRPPVRQDYGASAFSVPARARFINGAG